MNNPALIISLILLPLAAFPFAVGEEPKIVEAAEANAQESSPDLVKALQARGYTVFAGLVEKSGVMQELKKGEPFTCFAPRNDAFNMDAFERIMEEPANDELLEMVKYHFIQGNQPKDIILISRRERTLNGKFLIYWIDKDGIRINNHSAIIEADIPAEGGLIHGVTKVLRPDAEGAIP
jgi:uncharacterized surface protein with fasciclin (FAS1) repeats